MLGDVGCFMAGDGARFEVGDVFPFVPKDKGDVTQVGESGFVVGVGVGVEVKVSGGGRDRDCDVVLLVAAPFDRVDDDEGKFREGDETRVLVGELDGFALVGDVTRALLGDVKLLGDVDNDRPAGVVGVAPLTGVFTSSSSSSSIGISTPFKTIIFRLRR